MLITIQGSLSDRPGCWTTGPYDYVFDTSNAAGRNTLALALFAKANKQAVTVSRFNTCSQYAGVEDSRFFRLEE